MNRKDFFAKVGFGAALFLVPACIVGLETSCSKDSTTNSTPVQTPSTTPTGVDFTLDVSQGNLAVNGGFLVNNGIVVARTTTGTFLAVSSACTHQGTQVGYVSSSNSFHCPNHGANFSSTGAVTNGPATSNLTQYKTTLTGTFLRVFS